jgi:hypothetical protein
MQSGIEIEATTLLEMVEEAKASIIQFHRQLLVPKALKNAYRDSIIGWFLTNVCRRSIPTTEQLKKYFGVGDLTSYEEIRHLSFGIGVTLAEAYFYLDEHLKRLNKLAFLADLGDKHSGKVFVSATDLEVLKSDHRLGRLLGEDC